MTSCNSSRRAIIYALASILDPIALPDLFEREQPLEIELGSGDGSFLVDYARENPLGNFIGVERLLGRVRKMERKARRADLANLRGVRIESAYFLRYLLCPESVKALHIYFPDPWPKRRHRHHRLINGEFPDLAAKVLSTGSRVYLRTDDAAYFAQMREVFLGKPLFHEVPTPPELLALKTDFERDFLARGIETRHVAYERR